MNPTQTTFRRTERQMNLTHRFWQVAGLTMAVLAGERRWIRLLVAAALVGWLAGVLSVAVGAL
jgi:hypothetical protein